MSEHREPKRGGESGGRASAIKRRALPFVVVLVGLVWLAVTLYGMEATPKLTDCDLHEDAHDFPTEKFIYSALMKLYVSVVHRPSRSDLEQNAVTLVSITPGSEPLRVTTNTCEGRRFLSDLVQQLNRAPNRPAVIAIDKFFSDASCGDDTVNIAFRQTLAESPAKIVVGQATHARESSGKGQNDCLVETPLFDFTKEGATTQHPVLTGLTRLNQDTRKIPLQWAVFPNDQSAEPSKAAAPDMQPGFARVAARAASDGLDSQPELQELIRTYKQPYGKLPEEKHHFVSAMHVLCMGQPAGKNIGWGVCPKMPVAFDLPEHKIVVIGEHTDSDEQQTAVGDRFGVDLQATYIEDLLTGQYLRTFNFWGDFFIVCCFLLLYAALDLRFVASGGEEKEHMALLLDMGMLAAIGVIWLVLLCLGYVAPFSILMGGFLLILLGGRWAFWLLSRTNRMRQSGGEA